MGRFFKTFRKLGVSLIGFPIIAAGILLIPLPGPGVLIIIIGLLILSLEYDWAGRYVDRLKKAQKDAIKKAKSNRKR